MEQFLYWIAMLIARIHSVIMDLNNQFEYYLTDKELHFIIMGALGMIMIFVLYPLFRWLSEKGHIMIVTFLYVFTVIIGDRMDTDIVAGTESGVATVLVLSGISDENTPSQYAYQPTVILPGVGDIVK